MRTKIGFIQQNWDDNIGLLTITALLKKHGFDARVWVENNRTYRQIKDFSPDIVGYYCLTGDQKWILASIKKLRSADVSAKTIVGGPHPTFFPELIDEPLIDIICRGEGEFALLDLAIALEKKDEYNHIQNLYFKVDGKVIVNELRPLIKDLDSIPFPDRTYYDRYSYLKTNPYKIFITSRGCPFDCTFCFNHVLKDLYGESTSYVRRRSVNNVIAELLEVKRRWGLDEVRFSDDHFVLNSKWLKEFANVYKKELGNPYSVNARVDVLDEEKVYYLKESGCRLVCFGIENGREELRNKVLKKKIKDEQIFKAAELLKKYKIKFLSSNIIGLPNETAEDAWETIHINQKIRTNLPWFSMMQYYPGTHIYQDAKDLGLLAENFSMDSLGSYFKNDYLKQENISELQNIHSFSILVSRLPALEPVARILSRTLPPNFIFRSIFKLSYGILSFKRANFSIVRIIRSLKYYFKILD